jgi:hypothetical protein
MNNSGKWPYLCIIAVLVGFFLATWVNENPKPTIIQSPGNYIFEPEAGCEPYHPADSPYEKKEYREPTTCRSPFRNNVGFITTADIDPGTVFCVHYTTQPGGPVMVTWEALEEPHMDDRDDSNLGTRFRAKSGKYEDASFGAIFAGLEPSHSTHFQIFRGWNSGAFSTAGPCQAER